MSRLPEEWYEAIHAETGVYTTRTESDRVAEALEPLIRGQIAAALKARMDADQPLTQYREGRIDGLNIALRIVEGR